MNKQEFQRRLDEVETLIADGKYAEAVSECDLLNLDLLDQPRVLQNIAKAYEKCRRYADAEDLLLLAREYAPKSRGILFHLCSVSIKAGELQEAHRYYEEFEKRAKYDTQRFVLQYRIAKAENQPDEVLMKILDNFRKEEPDDRWMFELARLQAKNGLLEESRSTCEDIDLWFNSGKYVNMAHELLAQLTGEAWTPEPEEEEKAEEPAAEEEKPAEPAPSERREQQPFRSTLSEEEILNQETREIPNMNIQRESEEIPPIDYDFSGISDMIDEIQAEKKEQARTEESFTKEVPAEVLAAAESAASDNAPAEGFDAERDALLYGDTRVIRVEDETLPEEPEKPEVPEEEVPEIVEAETAEEAEEVIRSASELSAALSPAREAALQALRAREEQSALEERRIIFAEDLVVEDHSGKAQTEESSDVEKPAAEGPEFSFPEEAADAADTNPISDPAPAPDFSEEKDEHVVFRVGREEKPPVNPDTGMLPITEEEDDRDIANPIFIDFPDEVITEPQDVVAKEEAAEEETDADDDPFRLDLPQDDPEAVLLANAGLSEERETVSDPHVNFDETVPDRQRKSFRENAQEQINALQDSFDQTIEEQDDVEYIVSTIAKRKADEQLFGNLPLDPPVTDQIWHFIVFGETNTLSLDCAREHMKEISNLIPNAPGRMLKINSDRIGNANIVNSIDRFLGSMVVVEQAGSLSDEQLRDFAKILDKDDRSLLVVFTDTRNDVIEMFKRIPELAESFTAVFEGRILNARDLVNTAKEYLYSQGAKFSREADSVVYEKARELLGAKKGYYKSDMREYAEKALGVAEKGGFLGLSGGKVDRDGYLVVTEKHLRKAERA
ncbi:MAG: hypothetical protein IKS18_10715 [Lachnospiraceae bacterium]|nr:hypothetical protein [Lachnospiraceae bacterium]